MQPPACATANDDRLVLSTDVARAVGTALHHLLETLAPAADPALELARQEARLPSLLAHLLPPVLHGEGLAATQELLRAFHRSPLAARLRTLAPHLLARELPFVVPPEEPAATASATGPVAALIGTIDLVYRHPETGLVTIADWKTDRVGACDADTHAQRYRTQGHAYARAVQRGLELSALPHFEIWFLHAGCVVPVPLAVS